MTLSKDHIKRVNKALDYIEQQLENKLTLEEVAAAAHYSPYHFHRLFKAFTEETLYNYIARKRVEKASAVLLRKKTVTISELSTRYGFTSNSSFTRAFKKFYGMSPSHFRSQSQSVYSKIRQEKSKNGQVITTFQDYVCSTHQNQQTMTPSTIEVKTIAPVYLSGLTCIGTQALEPTFQKVLEWAGTEGLFRQPNFKMATIYHDSFKITAADKVRMTACVVTENAIRPEDESISLHIEKGRYIVGHYEIGRLEFETTWTSLFMWMNSHGYKMRQAPPFEIYHNNFNEHPDQKCIVDLYIPIEN